MQQQQPSEIRRSLPGRKPGIPVRRRAHPSLPPCSRPTFVPPAHSRLQRSARKPTKSPTHLWHLVGAPGFAAHQDNPRPSREGHKRKLIRPTRRPKMPTRADRFGLRTSANCRNFGRDCSRHSPGCRTDNASRQQNGQLFHLEQLPDSQLSGRYLRDQFSTPVIRVIYRSVPCSPSTLRPHAQAPLAVLPSP